MSKVQQERRRRLHFKLLLPPSLALISSSYTGRPSDARDGSEVRERREERGRLTSLQSGQLAASSSAIPLHFKSKGEDGPATRRRRTKIVKTHALRARKPLIEIKPFNDHRIWNSHLCRSRPMTCIMMLLALMTLLKKVLVIDLCWSISDR